MSSLVTMGEEKVETKVKTNNRRWHDEKTTFEVMYVDRALSDTSIYQRPCSDKSEHDAFCLSDAEYLHVSRKLTSQDPTTTEIHRQTGATSFISSGRRWPMHCVSVLPLSHRHGDVYWLIQTRFYVTIFYDRSRFP